MPRHVYKLGDAEPGVVAISLTDPWAAGLTDVCSATPAQFTDLEVSCQAIEAGFSVSQSVQREELDPTFCDPETESTVQSVTDEWTADLNLLLDEDVADGVAAFMLEHSREAAWLYIGTLSGDPPQAVAKVRLTPTSLFGALKTVRRATVSLAVDGDPAICFGNGTASRAVNNPPNPLNISSAWPGPAALADLPTLKGDATYGDTGTAPPYNGGTGTTAAFSTGQFIVLGDASQAHWDGSAWSAGAA